MSIYSILEEASASQGWNVDTQLGLVLEYIANQQDDPAFKDFIQHYVEEDEENSLEEVDTE